MTREEAISIMNVIVHMLEPKYDTDRIEDAVEMAISALSADGEYIKKEDALKAVCKFCPNGDNGLGLSPCLFPEYCISDELNELNGLPTYSFPDSAENKGDLISRQAVLGWIKESVKQYAHTYSNDMLNMWMLFEEQITAMPSVEKQGEWIPVSKRLPEIEHVVYCQLTDGSHENLFLNECEGRMTWVGRRTGAYNVIAWREMPEPYKGE